MPFDRFNLSERVPKHKEDLTTAENLPSVDGGDVIATPSAIEIESCEWEGAENLEAFLQYSIESCTGKNLSKSEIEVLGKVVRQLKDSPDEPDQLLYRVQEWRDDLIGAGVFEGKGFCVARAICEAAFWHIQRARSLEAVYGFEHRDTDPAEFPWFSIKSSETWNSVSALCKLALELCFDLPPKLTTPDLQLRIRALTLQGLALGHLGRFFEARHCFDDAHALLTTCEGHVQKPDVAPIHLRSAEVHLVEAHVLRRFCSLLRPQFLEATEDGVVYTRYEKLEAFSKGRKRQDDDGRTGYVALLAVRKFLKREESPSFKDLVAEVREQTGETWITETLQMFEEADQQKKEGGNGADQRKYDDGRQRFFTILSATLLAPTISDDERNLTADAVAEKVPSGAIRAAVLAAAQYYRMYTGHLRADKGTKNSEARKRTYWEEVRDSLLRQHYAKLDDAWQALEAAEHALSGRSHSSRWWGKLHNLRLLVFAEHLVLREPHAPALSPNEAYRRSKSLRAPHAEGGMEWPPCPRTLAFRTQQNPLDSIKADYVAARTVSPSIFHLSFSAIYNAARAVCNLEQIRPCEYEAEKTRAFIESLKEECKRELERAKRRIPGWPGGDAKQKDTEAGKLVGCLYKYAKNVENYLNAVLEPEEEISPEPQMQEESPEGVRRGVAGAAMRC